MPMRSPEEVAAAVRELERQLTSDPNKTHYSLAEVAQTKALWSFAQWVLGQDQPQSAAAVVQPPAIPSEMDDDAEDSRTDTLILTPTVVPQGKSGLVAVGMPAVISTLFSRGALSFLATEQQLRLLSRALDRAGYGVPSPQPSHSATAAASA